MINNKKKINKLKTENFLNEFPIIILLQHNNLTVNDWFDFKQKIQEISGYSKDNDKSIDLSVNSTPTTSNCNQVNEKSSNVEILNIKNSLLKKILLTSHSTKIYNSCEESLKSLCQGPNLIIGCRTTNQLNSIWNFINSNSKLIFISCLYKNQLLNHLDLKILLKTNLSIYLNLFQNLDIKTDLYNTLQNPLLLHPLFLVQYNFINTLSFIK